MTQVLGRLSRSPATVAVLCAALFCAAVFRCGAAGATEPAEFRLRDPGEMLPEMVLNDVRGQPQTLRLDQLERPVLLFFWSVYCPNCKEAMPGLIELSQDATGEAVTVWAINVDGERFSNAVRVYVEETELPFRVVYDRLEGDDLIAADPLGVRKTPTLYLADRHGRIMLRQVIEVDLEAVRDALARQAR